MEVEQNREPRLFFIGYKFILTVVYTVMMTLGLFNVVDGIRISFIRYWDYSIYYYKSTSEELDSTASVLFVVVGVSQYVCAILGFISFNKRYNRLGKAMLVSFSGLLHAMQFCIGLAFVINSYSIPIQQYESGYYSEFKL